MQRIPIIKIMTKEKFLNAKNSGNYGNVSSDAERIINSVDDLDLLELTTEEGSALNVISAKKVDEKRFCEVLGG